MKMLVLETCVVNFRDDRGGVIVAAGDLVDIDTEQSAALARAGRVLYTRKSDDPTRGSLTAPAEVVEAARAVSQSADKAEDKKAAE